MNEKRPFVTAEKLREITKTYPTPFHLYDERGIRKTARDLYKAFSWNPGFREFFAVKATPNPYILKILKEEGCGVDCASETELMLASAVGFSGDYTFFSSNVTPAQEYRRAISQGAVVNLDDFTHIDFLERVASIPETICCRYNPGGDFAIGNAIMDKPQNAKYGMTYPQLVQAFRLLREKGARRLGIHAFLASNTLTDAYYPTLARILFETAVRLQEETGVRLDFVNLSGGVGIPYRPGERANDIFQIGEGVRRAFEEVLVPAGMGNVKIYTELGRFMLGPYGLVAATVLHHKHIYKEYVGLDASAVDLMRPVMYGAYHHITVMGKEDWPLDHVYDVTGGLCENNDKFAVDRPLPRVDDGDLVVISDTGAHGFSMGYNYNGKLRSAELLLREDGSVRLIRRAETPKDYFATFDFQDEFHFA